MTGSVLAHIFLTNLW